MKNGRGWIGLLLVLTAGCDLAFVERRTRVQLDGAFESGVFTVPLNGPVDESFLPEDGAPRNGSLYLLSFDREQIPVSVRTSGSDVRVTPEMTLTGDRRYVLVITDAIRDLNNSRIGRERAFHDAYEGEDDADPDLRASLLEVRALLVQDRRELTPVVGVVFAEP
ncbi:MAG: hypothetical protein AAFX94_07515 [Myxococcota bacterium]